MNAVSSREKGLTLVELMVVVAIIGILAAVAVPQYQDFTARGQIAEAITLLSGVKVSQSEHCVQNGVLTTDITGDLGANISGKYVQTITSASTLAGGTLIATMKASGVNPNIAKKTVSLMTADCGATWVCGGSATDVPDRYLPQSCK